MVQSLGYSAQLLKQYQKKKKFACYLRQKEVIMQLDGVLTISSLSSTEDTDFQKEIWLKKSGQVKILIRQNRNAVGFNQECIKRLKIEPKIHREVRRLTII